MSKLSVAAKRVSQTPSFEEDLDEGWSDSESDPAEFPCPECGGKVRHDAWTLVNARKSPELAERLLAGTLFEFTCPMCGYTASLRSPCLYLDPVHAACVYLVVDESMAEGAARMFGDMVGEDTPTGRSRKRIVLDRHDLRGRAIALENGLDDRAVEILKMAVSGSAKQQGSVPADSICTVNLVGMENGDLVFNLESEDRSLTAVLPRGAYDLYEDALMRSSLAADQPYLIDRSWAKRAVDAFQDEGIL